MATPVDSQSLLPPISSNDITSKNSATTSSQVNSVYVNPNVNLLAQNRIINTEYYYFCGKVSHSAIMKGFALLTFFICAVYVI